MSIHEGGVGSRVSFGTENRPLEHNILARCIHKIYSRIFITKVASFAKLFWSLKFKRPLVIPPLFPFFLNPFSCFTFQTTTYKYLFSMSILLSYLSTAQSRFQTHYLCKNRRYKNIDAPRRFQQVACIVPLSPCLPHMHVLPIIFRQKLVQKSAGHRFFEPWLRLSIQLSPSLSGFSRQAAGWRRAAAGAGR